MSVIVSKVFESGGIFVVLEKLENIYLGALRVIILIAATIALLASIGGLISVFPTVISWTGFGQEEAPPGGTLGQFIDEQKITDTAAELEADVKNSKKIIFPDLAKSASIIKNYLGKSGSIKEDLWASSLQSQAMLMGDQSFDYSKDVLRLSEQLKKSKGKPLSEEKVAQLFSWHGDRYKADLEALALAKTETNAGFWIRLGASGAAFLVFVLIIFVFLFVKIERSLRTVGSREVPERRRTLDHA